MRHILIIALGLVALQQAIASTISNLSAAATNAKDAALTETAQQANATAAAAAAAAAAGNASPTATPFSSSSSTLSKTLLSVTCIRTYTISRGDSCRRISQQYGLTINDLYLLNPNLDCSNLRLNQELCLSAKPTESPAIPTQTPDTVPSKTRCTIYEVRPGDSCWFISFVAGISQSDLISFNPELNCAAMYNGQQLCISKPESTTSTSLVSTTPCKSYTISAGDTCYGISLKSDISAHDLLRFNPGLDCTALRVGQQVCVSDGEPKGTQGTPSPGPDGVCQWHRVVAGDSCASIGRPYQLSADDLEHLNRNTWRWGGCDSLLVGMKVCVSLGTPPLPDIDPNVECGLESPGNKTCSNHRCCSKWGYCGYDDNYCLPSNGGAPGTGCQSNCDTMWRWKKTR